MNKSVSSDKLWVVIPAAGVGKRMQVDHPKQYLKIQNQTILERSIACFSNYSIVNGIVVAISPEDEYWDALNVKSPIPLVVAPGGKERCHSVLNGLQFIKTKAKSSDWVMVHDAARPCLHKSDIQKLIDTLWQHKTGGLLGLPVADTLKYCGANHRVKKTINRNGLWRALTPQMFRYGLLVDALLAAINQPEKITDEASAIEAAGHEPVMVEGRWDNIKITHPQDLDQAIQIIKNQ